MKVLHIQYINHPSIYFDLNNKHKKLDWKRFLQRIKQLEDFINLSNNYQYIIFLNKIHCIKKFKNASNLLFFGWYIFNFLLNPLIALQIQF